MMEYLACFLFGAVVALTGVKVGSFTNGGERQEAAAKKNPDPQAEDDRDEQRRSKEIDEGIQNLMTFSVNGKDGFDVGGL
ncbi:hypothetical protein [Dysosmobacter welbionis]|jgi:hypothetical protein|uniref:Uncharacterized protein n=1 Tax=Dysosmobacter welbionis TaxID=2093857 RepID=A0A4D7AS48_9FIRM|nr:hypothetical protein [Dysosmobacter welbionis]QCI60655.1 hypothetical protein EIO64_16785 [Dysosmobacter welbionis]DAV97642.1 MAG TPA: hypothetical protein [Caudoviricetes sp.]